MPGVFNVSFLRPGGAKKGGGSGYGILIDQLAIEENRLALDGNLAPGDYDILIKMAQGFANSGALTADQRSNIMVKISGYKKAKTVSSVTDANEIGRLNREAEDDMRTINMMFGNNPSGFLQAQADLLQAKAERLTTSIEQIETAGGDPTQHWSEQAETFQQLQDTLDALDRVQNHAGTDPIGDFVVYLDTNSQGEITKMKVGRVGDESGYSETNAVYGGMQVYGKPNSKTSSGEKVFRLGATEYTGSDLMFQDPKNPTAFRSAPLLSPTYSGSRNVGVVQGGWESVDPANVRTQKTIRAGGFARGREGTLYESLKSGGYKKYVNTLPDQLGLGENDILDVPSRMEQGINAQSMETVDGMEMPQMSMERPEVLSSMSAPSVQSRPQASAAPAPTGRPRTPEPTERAPKSAQGIAGRTIAAAKNFLGIG